MYDTFANESDPIGTFLTLPSLESGAFRIAVETRFKESSHRQLLRTLRPLAVQEARERMSEGGSVSRLHLDKLDCIKEVISQLLLPEIFQPRYDRLLAQAKKKIKDEQDRTERLAHEAIPFVKIRQEAVGHGGFHHGILATHFHRTRWVYDCGSWRKLGRQALEKCIDDFASQCKRDPDNGHIEL